jgi:hypothetical protein
MAVLTMIVVCSTAARGEDPVYFADANLKAAVEAELSVTDPTLSDMLGLTHLKANVSNIASLTGLEYATNLSGLSLTYDEISGQCVVRNDSLPPPCL